jgi:hypothetical protein
VLLLGVAWASAFPDAVAAAAAGRPWAFVLGAVCGVLPNWLARLEQALPRQYDISVRPEGDPQHDATAIADAIVQSIDAVASGLRSSIRLCLECPLADPDGTTPLVLLQWRDAGRALEVSVTPPAGEPAQVTRPLPATILSDDLPDMAVTPTAGIDLQFHSVGSGRVLARRRTHADGGSHRPRILLAIAGLVLLLAGPMPAAIAGGALLIHWLVDRLGPRHPGARVLATGRPAGGLRWWHGPSPLTAITWMAAAGWIIVWNVTRLHPSTPRLLDPLRIALYGLALPWGLCRLLEIRHSRRLPAATTGRSTRGPCRDPNRSRDCAPRR